MHRNFGIGTLAPLESIKPDDYPRLSREGLGALKFNWRKANVKDDWTKGGRLSDAWDRVSGWPYWKKPSYDLDYGLRVVAKIAQEIPAWREVVGQIAGLLTSRMPQYAAWFDWVEERELDPNAGRYSYFTYRSLIPPGFAGVYNSPGYIGNGIKNSSRRDRGLTARRSAPPAASRASVLSSALAGGRAPVQPGPDLC